MGNLNLNSGQWLVIGICAVLIIGYIYGYYTNRQKAEKVHAWLKPGLEKWGKVALGEKLGGMATGGRLTVTQPAKPFQRIEAIYLLEPRDNLLFWIFNRLQGRRDELVIKISLPKIPKKDFEVKRDWRGKLIHKDEDKNEQVEGFLERYGRAIFQLAIRHQQPHLFVRARLPELMKEGSEAFITALQDLA